MDATDFERMARKTPAGMAHWAGTGPAGTTCAACAYFGYEEPLRNGRGEIVGSEKRDGCLKFFELMGRHGKAMPPKTPSCRHYIDQVQPSP
jgi:hypothetical protein